MDLIRKKKTSVKLLCCNSRIKFLFFSGHYLFKYFPLFFLPCIGFFDIFFHYQLFFYYKFLFILVIPFFFDLLYKFQVWNNDRRIQGIHQTHQITCSHMFFKEPHVYDLGAYTFHVPHYIVQQLSPFELEDLFQVYTYWSVRYDLAYMLFTHFEPAYCPKLSFLSLFLNFLFFSLLLFY